MTQLRNVFIASQDSPSIDAFARLRVSEPHTIFDTKNIFDDDAIAGTAENQPLFWDNQQTSGGSTTTVYNVNQAKQTLSVANGVAGVRVRQTLQRFNYQPGKSQLIFITFNLNDLYEGNNKRVGLFDENNGIFLEGSGTDLNIVRRTYTSNETVDNQVIQSSWNIDPMDGTGPSGITLDCTKTQILIIDFEWLGVGRVRTGFVIDGLIYYVHEFLNANNLTTVYMSTPNLPIRYEIENTGTGPADSIDCICSSVISEGGVEELGMVRSASTSTLVDANAAGTTYALIGLRLKSAYKGATVNILAMSMMETAGSKDILWSLQYNPTVAGAFTYNNLSNSAVQVAYGATANTVTNGKIIASGFFNSANGGISGVASQNINTALKIGTKIDGTQIPIVLCATPIVVTNADVYGSLTWRELI